MTNARLTVMRSMDHQTPDEAPVNRAEPGPVSTESPLSRTVLEVGVGEGAKPALGPILVAMGSRDEQTREQAWEACYTHYWRLVWTRVFYVIRTISWLSD